MAWSSIFKQTLDDSLERVIVLLSVPFAHFIRMWDHLLIRTQDHLLVRMQDHSTVRLGLLDSLGFKVTRLLGKGTTDLLGGKFTRSLGLKFHACKGQVTSTNTNISHVCTGQPISLDRHGWASSSISQSYSSLAVWGLLGTAGHLASMGVQEDV